MGHCYLGLALLAMGEALAFGSWPALMIVLSGVVPTIAWRARAEEKPLSRTFGERYAVYGKQTKMIIPHLLPGTAGIWTRPSSSDCRSSCPVWLSEAAMEPDRKALVRVGGIPVALGGGSAPAYVHRSRSKLADWRIR